MKGNIQTALHRHWREASVCVAFPLLLELVLHFFVYISASARLIYPCAFALALGSLLFILCTLFSCRINRIVFLTLTSVLTFYAEVQLVYHSIFGEFMSLWQLSFGAEAVTNFWKQMIYGIWQILPQVLAMLLPQAALFFLLCTRRSKLQFMPCSNLTRLAALGVAVVLHGGTVGVMAAGNDGPFSVYGLYTNPDTSTEISVKNVGLFTTARLECKYLLFGNLQKDKPSAYADEAQGVVAETADLDQDQYNVMDIDFVSAAASTESEILKNLDSYYSRQDPTEKNEYTGLFEGYNLITICAESFSPYLIDPVRTPALYEMATNGLIFENYFGSFGSNTTNGEYTFCMGLYPDLSRDKSTASFYTSQNKYLPFCLGNAFRAEGAQTWAYHNYTGEYYSRNVTHPNLGYTFQSATDGLEVELNWPSSDLEMMELSVDDYINSGEQFCAYYMTFSGHYQYNWDNPMSSKHRSEVEDLPYSEVVQAYIACNMEVEQAMAYLMERLEEAGIADRTVIVLTNDHYPYGLTEEEYNELAGKDIDPIFEKYRNSFLCYIPGKQIPVETYCSTVDILPTLLNLFGLEYDSRLLAGRDVLSPQAPNYAVLSDQSFVTPEYGFDAATGQVRFWDESQSNASANELENIQMEIANRFAASVDTLESDYYSHILLGNQEEGTEVAGYTFTDIPAVFSLGALEYLYEGGYMDPVSSTEFGFARPCTYGEFLDVLYRINGSPYGTSDTDQYEPAIRWATENGLVDPAVENLDSQMIVTRKNAAFTIYAYARYQGRDLTLPPSDTMTDESLTVGLSQEEQDAIAWCFHNMVMRGIGSMDSALLMAPNEMDRYQAVITLYNYYIYVERQPQ